MANGSGSPKTARSEELHTDDTDGRGRLLRVLSASNDGFWEWSVAEDRIWVSPRWSEITGLPASEGWVRLADLRSALYSEDSPAVLAFLERMVAEPSPAGPFEIEHRFVRPDGSEVWVDARTVVTARGPDGRALRVNGVITDITARKSSEERLRRYELIAANTRDIMLFMRRDDGRIVEANAAAIAAYGYSREQLMGMRVHDLRAPHTQEFIAEEMAVADAETLLFETAHRRRDGSTFPVEVSSRGATIGGERMLISVVRDITERKRAEEATHKAALFPAQNPSPVLRVSRDGVLLFANPASGQFLRQWDCEPGQEVPEEIRRAVQSSLDDRRMQELELVCDGREFSFLVTPIGYEGYANLYGFEITERKHTERVLARAEARQELLARVVAQLLESEEPQRVVEDLARQVMEQLGCDAFFNYLVDAGSKRLHLNACAGVDEPARAGLEWLDFGSAVCGCVARDGTRIIAEDIPETDDPRTRTVASFGIQAYACHPLIASGRLIGTLSFGSRTKRHFSDEDLELMRTVTDHIAIAVDRVRSRDLLRESEQRYRTIARNIPDGGVWVVDTGLRCLVAEGKLAEALGIAGAQIEGRKIREGIAEPACNTVEQRFLRALAGDSTSYETTYDGRTLWAQYVPLKDDHGNVTGAMALTLDVTERKRIEERLRQAQKMESVAVLAGGIAHDFNNLLVGIIGNASLALDMSEPGNPAAPSLREILQAGQRAAQLTNEMLAYSGRGRFVVQPANLSKLARDITSLVRSSVPNHVTVYLDLDSDLPSIQADLAQMQQILMNLVINAAEAICSENGLITVRTRLLELTRETIGQEWHDCEVRPGPYVCLEVIDTGCGMDEATLARIFDPFFTTKFTGRGLGLAAVEGIVRGHKGAIRVKSAPGAGSTFRIVFPVERAAGAETRDAENVQDLSGRATVLVVDDEEVVTRLAKATLERHGYRVFTATGGRAALEMLRNGTAVDLVLLDLSMPGMSGRETLGQIRRLRGDLRVMISSGFSEAECLSLFRNERISGFIQKPYTSNRLAQVVRTSLASE
jgi:PAS domain S-box-containing protein